MENNNFFIYRARYYRDISVGGHDKTKAASLYVVDDEEDDDVYGRLVAYRVLLPLFASRKPRSSILLHGYIYIDVYSYMLFSYQDFCSLAVAENPLRYTEGRR